MKIRISSIFVMLLLVTSCGESNPEAEKAGALASQQWLAIVDRGAYRDSWKQAALMFQSKVAESDWVKMVGGVRGPLGSNVSRSLAKTSYATSLPGAPDGEYVVSIFEASYEQKELAIETVTVVKRDGTWRVTGYFIK